jgi:tRNA A-37 threonylcarbamoyl transferase component Bud32
MNLGTPIAIGNTAKIYLFDNKIIKVFNDNFSGLESSYEANKQKCAYECGLAVPKVLEVTKINGKQAIVMEYIKGRTIGDILSENMEQAEYYLNISVDIQQEIHKHTANSLEQMSEKLTRQIESVHSLDTRQKAALFRKLEKMTFENKLCHGDFHLFNLILSDNKVTIIDWVDSSTGDRRADVYRTYLLYSQFSIEIANMYLQLYCQKSGFSKEEVFQWAPIIAGARLSEIVPSENPDRLIEIVNHYCPV